VDIRRTALIVFVCLVAGCASNAAKVADRPTVSLKRTACFGDCPAYEVSIRPTGDVEFIGKDYIRERGRRMSKITQDQYAGIASAVSTFSKFRPFYDYGSDGCTWHGSDHPEQIISVRTASTDETVSVNFGCSGPEIDADIKELQRLGKLIDEVAGTKQRIGPPGAWRETAGEGESGKP